VTETYGTSQAPPTAPGAPHDTFSCNINERDGSESVMNCNTSISTLSTPENANNTNTNTKNVYVYNVYKEENKLEAVVHSRVPLEIKAWLNSLSSQFQESESTIIRKLLIAAYQGSSIPQSFQTPTIILNYNVAKAESKPYIRVGEYIAMLELNDLLSKIRQLKARAERERQSSDVPLTFTVERAKVLEQELRKVLKSAKSLPPEKFREVEAALTILRSIREGPK
jgi:hypothetical protein